MSTFQVWMHPQPQYQSSSHTPFPPMLIWCLCLVGCNHILPKDRFDFSSAEGQVRGRPMCHQYITSYKAAVREPGGLGQEMLTKKKRFVLHYFFLSVTQCPPPSPSHSLCVRFCVREQNSAVRDREWRKHVNTNMSQK